MMLVRRVLGIMLVLAALFALGVWVLWAPRRVDGHTAAQWLTMVEAASRSASYQAVGTSTTGGHSARFVLAQGRAGCYTLRTTDAAGQCCTLGYDGQCLWYANDQHAAQVVAGQPAATRPTRAASRILGTGRRAGRPVVLLSVQSGMTRKVMAVDRQTGVILAMTTEMARRSVSEMRVDAICYQPVTVPRCAVSSAEAMEVATPARARAVLGRDALRPCWLPAGMAVVGSYLAPCCCNPHGMIIVRYSDGVSTLTLFQTKGCQCAMGTGCLQAPTEHALVESRTFGDIRVTAVGSLDAGTLQKVMASLR